MCHLRTLLCALPFALCCYQDLWGQVESDESKRTIIHDPNTIPAVFPVLESDGEKSRFDQMGFEGDWFKDGGPNNEYNKDLNSLSYEVRQNPDEWRVSEFEKQLEEFYKLITDIPLEAARIKHEHYSDYPGLSAEENAKTRANFEEAFKGTIALAEKRYLEYRDQYKTWVEFIKPYRAELEVEKQRTNSRRSKYKDLMLNYITTANVPSSNVLITNDYIYYVESVAVKKGELKIDAHLVYYPSSPTTSIAIHASFEGKSLGHTNTEMENGKATAKQGVDLGCISTIDVEDVGMPDSGVIELIVESLGVHEKMILNYNQAKSVVVKPGTEIVLHCRREGDHLILPAKFQEDESQATYACLVDTGASMTTIGRKPFGADIGKEEKFATVNGVVSMPVAVSHVTVGEIQKELSVAFSGDGGVNLLGANFFENFVYTIDLENSAIYLIVRPATP